MLQKKKKSFLDHSSTDYLIPTKGGINSHCWHHSFWYQIISALGLQVYVPCSFNMLQISERQTQVSLSQHPLAPYEVLPNLPQQKLIQQKDNDR